MRTKKAMTLWVGGYLFLSLHIKLIEYHKVTNFMRDKQRNVMLFLKNYRGVCVAVQQACSLGAGVYCI